jgi:hypothetical protein
VRTGTAPQFEQVKQSDRNGFAVAGESQPSLPQRAILQGWKEISTELGRSVRTVQRWERTLGLPIHRLGKGQGHPAFAFKDELQLWLLNKAADSMNGKSGDHTTKGKPVLVKGRHSAKKPALASEPEIIKALNAFFALEAARHKAGSCDTCESPAQFLVGHFWLYGTDKTWQVSVPFCPNCDSDVRALLPSSSPSQRIS